MESGAGELNKKTKFMTICYSHRTPQASKLGQRNKALIPTDARIVCTLKNLNFLLSYWLEFEAPTRIQDFGFRVDDQGAIAWDD